MPRISKVFPAVLLALLLAMLAGCASAPGHTPPSIPSGAALVSPQTPPSSIIAQAAQAIPGKNDLERLQNAMKYVGEHLAYDPSGNATQFDRTAPQLFTDMTLGGCSEFALAQLALVRAMGYPARLVLTMNAKWLERNRENPLSVPNGHSFVEVWAGSRWLLIDPTYFAIYNCPAGPNLPGNEITLTRALDFWDAGLTSVDRANAFLRQAARDFTETYRKPDCSELARVDFNYPAAFANLGNVFLQHGKIALAQGLFRKSAALDPTNVAAQIGLGQCLLQTGDPGQARVHFTNALALDPANPDAATGLTHTRP